MDSLMCKLRDRTISHADFLFILIKVNSSSKDQFCFIASALKEENLVRFDDVTPPPPPPLSSTRSRTKRFALHRPLIDLTRNLI